jgi:uncharacterized alpha-E superfamily protein
VLSRVADSLYWTARYIERAEDTSRLLHVNFHAMLDADSSDHGDSWRDLLLAVGREQLFREHGGEVTAPAVTEFLLWHPANPDSVAACVSRARANARGVREQLSSEMWEHLNRLHLYVSQRRGRGVIARPHDFLAQVRDGSQAFQGVTKATLPRGEAYEFLQLGAHLERADSAARILSVKQASLFEEAPEPVAAARMVHVLKCVGAMEAYRKHENDRLAALRVVRYLLLDRQAPRSVLFCLERCLAAIRSISGTSERPERAIGRIVAELSFADVGFDVAALLQRVLRAVDETAAEIASAYFTTRVILPGPYAQQQQQQQ